MGTQLLTGIYILVGKINTKQVKENISGSDEDCEEIKQDNMVGELGERVVIDRYNDEKASPEKLIFEQGPTVQNKLGL